MTTIIRRRPPTPNRGEGASPITKRRPPIRHRRESPLTHDNAASPRDADLSDDAGGGGVRMIPVVDEGDDVCRAAFAYAAAGIFVLPIDPRTKNPGSVLGRCSVGIGR